LRRFASAQRQNATTSQQLRSGQRSRHLVTCPLAPLPPARSVLPSFSLSLPPSSPPPSPPHPPLSLARALSLSSYLSLPSLSFSVYFPLSSSPFQRSFTEVKYPLLRACSSSAVLTAAGLHTHVRTHRTSSDPAYLHTYVYLYMKREEEEECC
jgi:hypothetical protein